MSELNYQTALLIQHKLDNELSDLEYAKSLQEHFRKEADVEVAGDTLSYSKRRPHDTSKSLIDPSWEVIDPTPDIFVLFGAFDRRFFWDKLSSVCVSWSKRMTTCAGVCSYQGRGGMCSIRLSEPLLKLRPRKDLVETLLHEMIHAYLFVTHNNRDRDGHGMEFQKHMFRINAESGTNITIYHDFHDEVRLYKQHWWKCDGPCRDRKPYYGMVKRAMNRAPGPTDRWWEEHSRSCGGSFIKIKEPEKVQKGVKTTSKPAVKSNNDIRKFFPKQGLKTGSVTSTVTSKDSRANVVAQVGNVIPQSKNIHGFTSLSGTSNNYTNTNKTPSYSTTGGSALNKNTNTSNATDYSAVRNAWLNKFSAPENTSKRPLSDVSNSQNSKEKIPKFSSDVDKVNCPICNKLFVMSELNPHIDTCLESNDTEGSKNCILCDQEVSNTEYERHVRICADKIFEDDVFIVKDSLTQCDVCKASIVSTEHDQHLFECLKKRYDKKYEDVDVECLACGRKVAKNGLDAHLDECMNLSNIFDRSNEPEEGEIEL